MADLEGIEALHVENVISEDNTPIGVVVGYISNISPESWMICDGSAIDRNIYSELFALIGTTYGEGNGVSTFNLPDLRQRFPMGKADSGTGANLGDLGGQIDHVHSVPSHKHGLGSLAIVSGGGHTHASGTLSADSVGDHRHDMSHNHAAFTSGGSGTLVTNTEGDHTHGVPVWKRSSLGDNTGIPAFESSDPDHYQDSTVATDGNGSHNHTVSSHTHSIDIPNLSGFTGYDGSHGHSVSGSTDTGGAHVHTTSGEVGNTGGSDGDSEMTSGSQNPPYLVLNYIIKVE